MIIFTNYQKGCIVDELVALKEGFCPDSEEALIVRHQIIDLAPHIPRLGLIQSLWGTWGERVVGSCSKRYHYWFKKVFSVHN